MSGFRPRSPHASASTPRGPASISAACRYSHAPGHTTSTAAANVSMPEHADPYVMCPGSMSKLRRCCRSRVATPA
eukprot:4171368-Prymnesium_polylepis.2